MPRLLGLVQPLECPASQKQIANDVQQFVTDELVLGLEATWIDHHVIVDHDRVVDRRAEPLAHGVQLLSLMRKTEGARPRNLARKGAGRHREADRLPPDGLRGEVDGDPHREVRTRRQARKLDPLPDFDRLQHLQHALRPCLMREAGALQQRNEGPG